MLAEYSLDTLPNGLRIAVAEMPHMASVSVGFWASVGGRHEPARLNGAAHFLEHLLFKGTARRSARQISGEVEALGGYLEAFTAEDHTCYYAKAEEQHLKRMGDVLADIYLHSKLPAAEVKRERGVIREEILMYQDQPAQIVEDLLAAAVWPSHSLGRPLAGTLESIEGLTRDELMAFWRSHYHARSTVVAVAGKVRREDALRHLAPLLEAMPAGRIPRFTRWNGAANGDTPPRVRFDRQDCEQLQLAMGFVAPGRRDRRRFAVRVLSALLGEKMNSRLFQSLRERRGMCYSIQSEQSTFEETGLLGISAGMETRRLPEALGLIRHELDRLCDQLVGEKELREAKGYLVGQNRLAMESTVNQMMWMGECLLGHGRLVDPVEVRREVEAVDAQAVREAARACFREGFRAIALVGPVKASEEEVLGWFGVK
jgi:predicted Zn-dependent peptidase